MTKKTTLNYNTNKLTNSLKASTGKGVDAFFPQSISTSKPQKPQVSKETRKQASLSGSLEGNKETRKQPRKQVFISDEQVSFDPAPPSRQRLYRKQTFAFNETDMDFLDTVKFELRELGVTKNEIVRAGIELLARDYQGNKETSFLVRKFGRKQGNNPGEKMAYPP